MTSPHLERPIHVREIAIRGLRIFDDFRLRFGEPARIDRGQWALLLGDNGVGKTTILRALVLNLDYHFGTTLLQLTGPSAPFLRHGHLDGHVSVSAQVGSETSDRSVRIRPRARDVEDIEVEVIGSFDDGGFLGEDPDLPIYAYGCQRGNALGSPAREAEVRPLDDVRNLFDDTVRLIHAETWLKELRRAALEDPPNPSRAVFDAVCKALTNVLDGVERIEFTKDGVLFEGPGVDRAPLAALSDGYVTTAGWVIDLIARWADRCRRAGVELDGDFCEKMTGLVLIDEIDLHLHPRWQLEIVPALRAQFPRLSFIATTHNPLTLLGAKPGEIHVLRRDPESGRVVAEQRDVPAGARADQVLTGEWFGLASTVDLETRALLAEHRRLLRRGVDPADPGRRELEHRLRLRLGTFADTSVDRMVQSIAAELMGDGFEELSPEDRASIREKVLRLARERTA